MWLMEMVNGLVQWFARWEMLIFISQCEVQVALFECAHIILMDCFMKKNWESYSNFFPSNYTDYLQLIDQYMMEQRHKNILTHLQLEDKRRQEVNLLEEINVFDFRLIGDAIEELQVDEEEEDERDEELKRRIQQYNQIMRPREKEAKEKRSRRHGEGRSSGRNRKTRTTITQAKLDEMNKIFSLYYDYRQNHKDDESEDGQQHEYGSLKSIGEKLGLGYSTILHKFREFRATKKVKGGALIQAMHQKRKYKKSREIEQLISKSLNEGRFHTAVELSRHIEKHYNVTLSRSIISRHLGQMGYSYKNIKAKPVTKKNTIEVKDMRRKYSLGLNYLKDHSNTQVYFLDKFVFSAAEFLKRSERQLALDLQKDEIVVLLVLLGWNGVAKYMLKTEAISEEEFLEFLVEAEEVLARQESVVVLDLEDQHHTSERMSNLRERMRDQGIRYFYVPPASNELNALEWLFPKIKEGLAKQKYDSLQDLRDAVEGNVEKVTTETVHACYRESEEYMMKGANSANF